MLNHLNLAEPFIMGPDGSLNRLSVSGDLLHVNDPLHNAPALTGFDLVSSAAFLSLLKYLGHQRQNDLRAFIANFSMLNMSDHQALTLFAYRFTAVLKTAKNPESWGCQTEFLAHLGRFWQQTDTVVISGGLSSNEFGIQLAEMCESLNSRLTVISSHWGGSTALYGMAQTISQRDELLVLDFGATSIKRGVAYKYGNQIDFLPNLTTSDFKVNKRIDAEPFREILKQTRRIVGSAMPVAISIACYLNNGHPFQYHSGVYYNIAEKVPHLATAINDIWLPHAKLGELKLLVHDSTAAALAFRVKQPAMMVTLGTGLGSAPCPMDF